MGLLLPAMGVSRTKLGLPLLSFTRLATTPVPAPEPPAELSVILLSRLDIVSPDARLIWTPLTVKVPTVGVLANPELVMGAFGSIPLRIAPVLTRDVAVPSSVRFGLTV